MPAIIRLGTQGWNYDAWVGPFYPTGTRAADYLTTYTRAFGTVEVDSTFYAIPPAKTVLGWAQRTPPGFVFSLKLPQEITHERKFRGTEDLVDEFLARARLLDEKLGAILVQLGPDFGTEHRPALEHFLGTLPDDVRVAVEFRQREWITRETHDLLADHGVALALSDGRWIPRPLLIRLAEHPSADFAYVRWMGPNRDLTDYSRVQVDRTRELEAWSEALREIAARVQVVYGYANNHFAGHSPATIRELQTLLGQSPVPPEQLGEQISLF